ncbi:MAG TPA: glycosyltransferase family 87 protein [Pirellulales bacterium]|nr:glycosyltransferase family 87 protein [Pirellulales bacterium]
MEGSSVFAESGQPRVPRTVRWLVRGVLLALFIAEFVNCVFFCDHDFLWHRNFGQSFIDDQLYVYTGQHYLPARAMFDAATAWIPYRLDRAIWFLAMCAGVAWCTYFWSRIGKEKNENWIGPMAVAVAIAASYIHRDLAECGLQIFLLCLLTAALAALLRNKPSRAGIWLGLATLYKVMPVLFFPYLLWKRQWKAAGWMVATACLVSLLPAVRLGWRENLAAHGKWLRTAAARLAIEDPSENGIEEPALWNRSLPLALARLVQYYPPGHSLHVESPGDLRIATLEPRAAKRFVQISLLALAALLAWRFRHRADFADGGAAIAGEWAMVCVLVAELSPLCWLHHLILAMPAMLLFAQTAAAGRAHRWQWATAGVASLLILLVHRGLLGESVWSVVSAIHPHTLGCLLIGAVALSPGRAGPKPCAAAEPMNALLRHAA